MTATQRYQDSRARISTLALIITLLASAGLSVDLAVSPTTVAWNQDTWVTCAVSGVTPGANVELELYRDVDRDGVVGAGDLLVRHHDVTDGATNTLGALSIVDDTDGAANGAISSRVSYFGNTDVATLWKAVGQYLWVVRDGGASDTIIFTVAQGTSTASISGYVQDSPSSNPVPGALVTLDIFAAHLGLLPATYTDTNGLYQINIPASYPLANIASIEAMKPGAMMAETWPGGGYFSELPITTALSNGPNVAAQPLWVVNGHGFGGDSTIISGTVYDHNTNPVPGTLVSGAPSENDWAWGMALTDDNGAFSFPMLQENLEIETSPISLTFKGLLPTCWEDQVTSSTTNIDLHCSAADLLLAVSVTDAASGVPIVGAVVEAEADDEWSAGFTISNGVCEIPLTPGGVWAALGDEEFLSAKGYLYPPEIEDVNATGPSPFTNIAFRLSRGAVISGHVYDQSSNALAFGSVEVYHHRSWDWLHESGVNREGYFEALSPTGTVRMLAYEFDGFISASYSNYYTWEWDNGPKGDPIEVGPGGVTGVDFYLEQAALISGMVRDNQGNPLNAEVEARLPRQEGDDTHWDWRGSTETRDGRYELQIPAGTGYRVRAWADNHVSEYYDGFYQFEIESATGVDAVIGAPKTNINFALDSPGYIQGHVREGGTPLEDMRVEVSWVENVDDWWDNTRIGDVNTDSQGYYEIPCPPGANFSVYVSPDRDSFYVPEFWSNVYNGNLLTLVEVDGTSRVENIDFDLVRGGRIEGQIFDINGTDPYYEGYANVETLDGEVFNAWTRDAMYDATVPAGTYRVSFGDNDRLNQWYDGVYDSQRDQATSVTVLVGQVTSGIDFTMLQGSRIEGRVTHNGAGVAGITVEAHQWIGPEWWEMDHIEQNETEGDGSYALVVPPHSNYVVICDSDVDRFYPRYSWSNTFFRENATHIEAPTEQTVSGIDFDINPGYRINVQILAAPSNQLIWDAHVGTIGMSSGKYMDGENAEGRTWCQLVAPTGIAVVARAHAPGYVPEMYEDTYYSYQGIAFDLAPGVVTNITIVLHGETTDTDGDGIPDHEEDSRPDGVYVPGDDNSSLTNADTDSDGHSDYEEVRVLQTNPRDADSRLDVTRIDPDGGSDVEITWISQGGVNYWIESTTDLTTDSWTRIGGPYSGSPTITQSIPSGALPTYYRIVTQGP